MEEIKLLHDKAENFIKYDIYTTIDKELAENLLQTAIVFNNSLKIYLQENGFLT